jgi:hypothetical protein
MVTRLMVVLKYKYENGGAPIHKTENDLAISPLTVSIFFSFSKSQKKRPKQQSFTQFLGFEFFFFWGGGGGEGVIVPVLLTIHGYNFSCTCTLIGFDFMFWSASHTHNWAVLLEKGIGAKPSTQCGSIRCVFLSADLE